MQLQENTDAYHQFILSYGEYSLITPNPISFEVYCKERGITIKPAKQRKTYYEPTKDN